MGPIGIEPMTKWLQVLFLLGISFIVENKGWEGGPGRIRTCDLADNGLVPVRLHFELLN